MDKADIVVRGLFNKPYYVIIYHELGKDYELFWALGTPIIVAKKDNVILSLFSMVRVEDSVTSTNFR